MGFVSYDGLTPHAEMTQRSFGPFTREPVQRPKQNQFKFPTFGSLEHALKGFAVARAACASIDKFLDNIPALLSGIRTELIELVQSVLFIGAHSAVNGDFHLASNSILVYYTH